MTNEDKLLMLRIRTVKTRVDAVFRCGVISKTEDMRLWLLPAPGQSRNYENICYAN